jgi:DNA invertase Pin-like site-specific DNA recombinase
MLERADQSHERVSLSVSLQTEHDRRYVESKGWAVDEAFVFSDDGISGAEFAARPGFDRLMIRTDAATRVRRACHV